MYRCSSCHRRVAGSGPCPRDGHSAPEGLDDLDAAPAHVPPGAVAGFEIGGLLGSGGFAAVWSARRESDGAAAAIKVALGNDGATRERFRLEAEALARVGAPHVPALFGSGCGDDGRPWIAMAHVAGRLLAEVIAERDAPFEVGAIGAIGGAVLEALAAIHAQGIIHRDLKPENVFLVESAEGGERATIIDLGLTRRAAGGGDGGDGLTRTGAVVGTSEYMAPEQLRGERAIDGRADLYAFGVVLYELCTLRPPFVGDAGAIEHGHLALRPPRPGAFAPIPPALEALVLACLAKDPARRPASAAAVRRDLAEACLAPGVAAPPSSSSSSQASGRLIAEKPQPAVILVADVRDATTPIAAAVSGRGGFLLRQRGRRYVAVFSGLHADDPGRAALAAARLVVDAHGGRAALHLAPVALRFNDRGVPSAFGAPIDRPESWLPPEPWSGVAVSAAIADMIAAIATTTDEASADTLSITLRALDQTGPLLGRGAELEKIAASAAAVAADGRPGLFTLIGGPGLGKSRLAAEATAIFAAACPGARVLAFAAAQPGLGPPVAAALLTALLDAESASKLAAAPHHERMRAIADGLLRLAGEGPLAVVLDDAHWADDATLDALDYAALGGVRAALWVFVAAHPRFARARPSWGERAQRHDRATLAPLGDAAAAELAAHFLLPAEYPPAAVLSRLAAWSGGNPLSLSEIVAALKRLGIVRQRDGATAHYVATAELDRIPPSPGWQWIAARQMEGLAPEIAAFARLTAALGPEPVRGDIEAVQEALERAGAASTPVDVGFGLAALVDRGLLRRAGDDRYAFPSALVHDAIYEMLDAGTRDAIHRAALAHLATAEPTKEVLTARAWHAAGCGVREEAADANLRLGDLALSRHRLVEADQHYTATLAATDDVRQRAQALAGRGKCRYLIWRVDEALADLAEARTLVETMGDRELIARLLLEEATALDWLDRFNESAARVREAAAILAGIEAPHLAARLLVAEGRTEHRRSMDLRQGDIAVSLDLLARGIAVAVALGDDESRAIGLLLLATELAWTGRLEEAEARFEEVIAVTRATEDWTHLCVAFINRIVLWDARQQFNRAIDDLKQAIDLAREIGNPLAERMASSNVASVLHFTGRTEEALEVVQRSRVLEERFVEQPASRTAILLARILLALDRPAEARPHLEWAEATCPPDRSTPVRYALYRLAQGVLAELLPGSHPPAESRADLSAILAGEKGVTDEQLEVLYWEARMASRRGDPVAVVAASARAEPLLAQAQHWKRRFDAVLHAAPVVGTLA